MNKLLYLVAAVDFDYFRVVGIYSTRELAEKARDLSGDPENTEIEEYELDESERPPSPQPPGNEIDLPP